MLRLDVVRAFRALRTQAIATTAILAVLALGIGLASTMFALADPFVARPLPYPSAHELVVIQPRPIGAGPLSERAMLPKVRDWRARTDLFQSLAPLPVAAPLVRMRQGDTTIALRVAQMDTEALRMLGQRTSTCDDLGAAACLLLTPATRDQYFAHDEALTGRSVAGSTGTMWRLGGVLPRAFILPKTTAQALVVVPASATDEASVTMSVQLARRQPGVAIPALQSALVSSLADAASEWSIEVESLDSVLTAFGRETAWGAICAGLLILAVCAASVANLLFARAWQRTSEFATRRAMGASALDLLRLVATELALMAALAIAGGMAITWAALTALRGFVPIQYATLGEPGLNLRVLGFAALVGAITIAVSAVAAWLALVTHAGHALSASINRRGSLGRTLRFAAVTVQNALAMILVTATVLLGRSYLNLFGQETGFSGTATVISASYPPTTTTENLRIEVQATLERLRRVPGVAGTAAMAGGLIDNGRGGGCCVSVEGRMVKAGVRTVTQGFFEAAGTAVVMGRTLRADDANAAGVVVNEAFASQVWPEGSPLGRLVRMGGAAVSSAGTVVGVVKNTFDGSLDRRPDATVYALLERPTPCSGCETRMTYLVRPSDQSSEIAGAAARAVSTGAADAVVTDVSSVRDRLTRSVADRVFSTLVVSLYTLAGLAVCVAGLVGVVSFVTAQRARELAIRMAIGAGARHVMYVVSFEALAAAVTGIGLGFVAARFGSVTLATLAYDVQVDTWITGVPSAALMLALVSLSVAATATRVLKLPVVSALKQE